MQTLARCIHFTVIYLHCTFELPYIPGAASIENLWGHFYCRKGMSRVQESQDPQTTHFFVGIPAAAPQMFFHLTGS